jgi:hypothetical protein
MALFFQRFYEFSRTDFFDGFFALMPTFDPADLGTYLTSFTEASTGSNLPVGDDDILKQIDDVFNPVILAYINTLIYEIEPPKDALDTDDIDFGIFKINYPKGFKALPFQVTFIDDVNNTVQQWYTEWNSLLVQPDATFSLLSKAALSFSLVRSLQEQVFGLDLPRSIDYYPAVFPVLMDEPVYSKKAGDFRMIKLTFNRLITVKMPDPSWSTGTAKQAPAADIPKTAKG